MAQKIGLVRSKKAMKAAEGRSCVNCGCNDGTTVRAHYQGMRSGLSILNISDNRHSYAV